MCVTLGNTRTSTATIVLYMCYAVATPPSCGLFHNKRGAAQALCKLCIYTFIQLFAINWAAILEIIVFVQRFDAKLINFNQSLISKTVGLSVLLTFANYRPPKYTCQYAWGRL